MNHCESSNRTLCSCDNINSTKINSIVQCQLCSNNQCSSDSGCRNNIQNNGSNNKILFNYTLERRIGPK